MATKTKETKETKAVPLAPVTGPVPPGLNDRREDGAPVLGHFVEVTKGENKGFFGTFLSLEGETAVVRAHNNPGYQVSVPFEDIEAASLNR